MGSIYVTWKSAFVDLVGTTNTQYTEHTSLNSTGAGGQQHVGMTEGTTICKVQRIIISP